METPPAVQPKRSQLTCMDKRGIVSAKLLKVKVIVERLRVRYNPGYLGLAWEADIPESPFRAEFHLTILKWTRHIHRKNE